MQSAAKPSHSGSSNHRPRALATLIVYAPFGTDTELSNYPGDTLTVDAHPLTRSLEQVAALGVNICALIDRVDDDTTLLQIPAFGKKSVEPRWKHDMASPRTLAGLVRHALETYPSETVVLSLEGHGAGYIPDLDRSKLSLDKVTKFGNQSIQWLVRDGGVIPVLADGSPLLPMGNPLLPMGNPLLPMGNPLLPMGNPLLPMGNPLLPKKHAPMSTWGLHKALEMALSTAKTNTRKLSVIHFNSCFNMSVEVLHTIAPYADYATGYANYNFFSAGGALPMAFSKLADNPKAGARQLSRWLAEANRDWLAELDEPHPTVGASIELAKMESIGKAVHAMSRALTQALRTQPDAAGQQIEQALVESQQYDTGASYALEAPDELTDIASFADALTKTKLGPDVVINAMAVKELLAGAHVYGVTDQPWVAPDTLWPLDNPVLAMNILCPDPLRNGLWDWRSPYYLINEPGYCEAQQNIVPFLREPHGWVEFLIEYHRNTGFKSLLAAHIPEVPVSVRRGMAKPKSWPQRHRPAPATSNNSPTKGA